MVNFVIKDERKADDSIEFKIEIDNVGDLVVEIDNVTLFFIDQRTGKLMLCQFNEDIEGLTFKDSRLVVENE